MIHLRSPKERRRPQHALPCVLPPSRRVITATGGLGLLAAGVVAACAVAAGGQAGAVDHAAPPAAPSASTPARGTTAGSFAAGSPLVQRLGAGDFVAAPPAATGATGGAFGGSLAGQAPDAVPVSGLAASGIPSAALAAYKNAANREAGLRPSCGLTWPLLAGIGRVESDHGRFAGAVLHADGVSTPKIIGIQLNGHGTARIRDTDHGRLDGDTVYDRAVGPMQFIPSTWAGWGVDANGDGVADPFNIFDAAAASADYLCAAGHNLTTTSGQVQAILSYNYSTEYVSLVMGLENLYAAQVGLAVPVAPTAPPSTHHAKPTLPPVDPGRPDGLTAQPTTAGHSASGSGSRSSGSSSTSRSGSVSGAGSRSGAGSGSGAEPGSGAGSGSGSAGSRTAPTGGTPSTRTSTPTSGSTSPTPSQTSTCPTPSASSSPTPPSSPASSSSSASPSNGACPSPSDSASTTSSSADGGSSS